MKKAQAGSVESNDILITVSESDTLEINITSIVSAFFYDQIYQVITSTLQCFIFIVSIIFIICIVKCLV